MQAREGQGSDLHIRAWDYPSPFESELESHSGVSDSL